MFGGTLLPNLYIAAAAVAGFAAGAMLSRFLGSFANRPMGKRADDLHHRIRGLEADLRVAQRTADQARTERETLTAEMARSGAELATLRDRQAGNDELIRKLKTEIQSVWQNRPPPQELPARPRNGPHFVQLRDVRRAGRTRSARRGIDKDPPVERERDDLNTWWKLLAREEGRHALP